MGSNESIGSKHAKGWNRLMKWKQRHTLEVDTELAEAHHYLSDYSKKHPISLVTKAYVERVTGVLTVVIPTGGKGKVLIDFLEFIGTPGLLFEALYMWSELMKKQQHTLVIDHDLIRANFCLSQYIEEHSISHLNAYVERVAGVLQIAVTGGGKKAHIDFLTFEQESLLNEAVGIELCIDA